MKFRVLCLASAVFSGRRFNGRERAQNRASGSGFAEITRIRDEILRSFNVDPDLKEIAERHGMSVSTMRRNWSRYFSDSPKQLVLKERIERAGILLLNSSYRINEIADKVGFSDPFYFSRAFKKHTGNTPTEFRAHYVDRVISAVG